MHTPRENLICVPIHAGARPQEEGCALLRTLSAQEAVLHTRRALRPGQQMRLELKVAGVSSHPECVDARVLECQSLPEAEEGWSHRLRVAFSSPRILGRRSWPAEGHLQTLAVLLPVSLGKLPTHEFEDVYVPVKEGALLARTHWLPGRRPLVILLHGVAGASENPYMHRAAISLLAAGYHVVRLNLRGAGQGRWLASNIHHICLTDDLDAAVQHFSAQERVSGVLAVGFSLGGNLALAAAAAPPSGLRGVASISAPMDLQQTITHLERSQPLYHHYVLRGLQDFIRRHGEAWPEATPPEQVARALRTRSIREFDDQIMAPRHGFHGVADYYARTSCGPRLRRARIPCLVIHADDDPMVPLDSLLPYVDAAAGSVTFLRLPHGGHVGFLAGWGWSGWQRSRAMEAVVAWARELLPPLPGNA